jgi:alkaline phosphatase
MSIGNYATSKNYGQTELGPLLDPLRKMKLSAFGMWKQVGDERTPEKVKEVVDEYWDIQISDEEADQILELAQEYGGSQAHNAFGIVLCPIYTRIGWTTGGHTGGDVPLFALGPGRPVGLLDGPDVGKATAAALGLDLDHLNRRLFQEAIQALPGATVTIEEPTPNNFVVKVEREGQTAELPANKNLLRLGDETIELEGVVVCVRDEGTLKAYLPMQAVNLITGETEELPEVHASATSP